MSEFGITIRKGVTYATCFWVVYKLLNALWSVGSPINEEQARAAQDEYVRQQKKAAILMTESEKQFKRMDALITMQEENARRFDGVLTQMEKSFKK